MEELKTYINTIVVAIMFVTFIEILMPNSSMKRYTKMVLGLLVMTIILNPILSFLRKDFSLSEYSFKYQNQLDSIYLKKQSSQYTDKQSNHVSKLYRDNLEEQIEQYLIRECNIDEAEASVNIVDDSKSEKYGQIININIIIKNSKKAVDPIKKIDISTREEVSEDSSQSYESLKNKISAMYDIPKDKIKISKYY